MWLSTSYLAPLNLSFHICDRIGPIFPSMLKDSSESHTTILFVKLIFSEVYLLYNVLLVSTAQQGESVLYIYLPSFSNFLPKRRMDKENVVHIYNGILFSHKKEQNWVICRDMDGPRDCQTDWTKSEREKQYHILTHVCVLMAICVKGNGTPLQHSCLENPMDGGAWWAAVHGVTKSRTQLSDFTFTFHFHALEKEMATHSSVLAWRIPGMGEPGGLPSMGSHRVRQDWSNLAAAAATHIWVHDFWKWSHFSIIREEQR